MRELRAMSTVCGLVRGRIERRTTMSMIKSAAAIAVGLGLLAGSALAQQQEGLVNVAIDVEDNVVQVPIGIAAQVCGIDAAVLAQQENTDDAVCTITQDVA